MGIGIRQFDRLIDAYQPLPFERFPDGDPRFRRRSVHWALKNRHRLSLSVRTAARYFPAGPFTVADFGPYPGSLLRLLRRLFPPERCRLVGVGLDFSEDFRARVPADCGAELLIANLDPRNHRLQGKPYPTRVPLDDASVDFVFALEVVEHLISPRHLFAEAFRVLKPGGRLLVTTPNVARIGNVFKILVGRSPYERLLGLDDDTER
ncbi:MAG: class I SAM-dependent methyltransferase, partial [Candidatus Rokubacteria bacterium]|nr:class I SAM-dependent methyltransferase [Candidatus Rokubacteria bacterium]